MAATLRSRISGERRLQRRVGAAGAAAQALVVELDDVGDVAEHGAHGAVGPLHVAEVARVLDDHGPSGAAGCRQAVDALGEPLVDVDAPGRRRPRASAVPRRWP